MEMRASDLLSNEELSRLEFKQVHFLKSQPYDMKPLVSPVAFFAGKVQQALDSNYVDPVSRSVLNEAVDLLLVLLHKLEFITDDTFKAFVKNSRQAGVVLLNQPQNQYHSQARRPPHVLSTDHIHSCGLRRSTVVTVTV